MAEVKEVKGMAEKKCPRCGQPIVGYPALSRIDNTTEICSDCGTMEALEQYLDYLESKQYGGKEHQHE